MEDHTSVEYAQHIKAGPGESKTYGLKFLLSDSIRNIEKTLADNGRPVAVGVPGYVLPMDIEGRLFVKYPKSIKSIEVGEKDQLRFAGKSQSVLAGSRLSSRASLGGGLA